MRISPDIIPHSEFHTGIWLQSTERPSWYYFKKKKNLNLITNEDYMECIDPPLKELVSFLHKKGIRTTPSCSGHHFSKRKLESTYQELIEDSLIIKNRGLYMKDIESGRLYLKKDKNYSLPWTKEVFMKSLNNYQQIGVIGIRLNKILNVKESLLQMHIEGVKVEEKDSIMLIFTNEKNEQDTKNKWNEITKQVKKILD